MASHGAGWTFRRYAKDESMLTGCCRRQRRRGLERAGKQRCGVEECEPKEKEKKKRQRKRLQGQRWLERGVTVKVLHVVVTQLAFLRNMNMLLSKLLLDKFSEITENVKKREQ